jgi:two-component system sensor histidine kinase RegB
VHLRVSAVDGAISAAVTDSGGGMSAATLARLGEPFFTTKSPGQGMGLGLFLARTLAEQLGGALELQSAPGAGTTATLRLSARSDHLRETTSVGSAGTLGDGTR